MTTSYTFLDQTVTLPVEVRDARQAAATFRVPAPLAERLLPPGLKPQRLPGNSAIATIAVVDYLDNDLGRYGEVGLAILVEDNHEPRAKTSTCIHRLPVDGAFTCDAGRGIWGFPKWVADLDVRFDAHGCSAVLHEGEHIVLRVELKRGRIPMPNKPMEMAAWTNLDGTLRRTPWTNHGGAPMQVRPGGARISIGYGHPLADELRSLGLPKRALAVMFNDHMRATFGGATEITASGNATD